MSDLDRLAEVIRTNLREIPDYPEPGVLFRDITPLLAHGPVFADVIKTLADHYRGSIDAVAGLESRGFILAAPMAVELGIGMITVRKAGKLPPPVIGVSYELEYGSARLEVRPETIVPGERILIVDDVLATGGTAKAAIDLIAQSGGTVTGLAILMELLGLGGREKLAGHDVLALLAY